MLAAVYIKGFKTFARPVRMPLERGITAIVGPNGSGKSNITDAVLFALGEQSPGVLRVGAMSELIFSGSETLPASGVAEVTLVVDNSSRRVSLPYEEVSITRRISRGGETEYRINGSRARLADVRAVAGEAGLGRHSILRQGAVDAIVAGGAAACRHALEEAAGLGVFRRRRLSASRKLEKADAQLEKSRELEAELSAQLRRIEREAVAAREYRALEGRYRRLSLAHLYRVATRGQGALRANLEEARAREARLAASAARAREEESALSGRLAELERGLGEAERLLEAIEDGGEELRGAASRVERSQLRLEAAGDPRRSIPRLEGELDRARRSLAHLAARAEVLEREYGAAMEESEGRREALSRAKREAHEAERERARLASRLEGVRARLEHASDPRAGSPLSEGDLEGLERAAREFAEMRPPDSLFGRLARVRSEANSHAGLAEELGARIGRRRGALEAAIGRAESRVRSLRRPASTHPGPRLCEVIRPKPGFEGAVEAALGEYGAGILARNLREGLEVLSGEERIAVRLDAGEAAPHGHEPPGRPLLECVEVLDGRYAEPVRRLLDGTCLIEGPAGSSPGDPSLDPRLDPRVNGYVVVTREGLRLTRTSVSLRRPHGGFARERRLAAALERIEVLKGGPGEALYDATESVAGAARRSTRAAASERELSSRAHRARHAAALLSERAGRRLISAREDRRERLRRARIARALAREGAELERELAGAVTAASRAGEWLAAASEAADDARAAASEAGRRLGRERTDLSEAERRREALSRELHRLRDPRTGPQGSRELLARAASRATAASAALAGSLRERRLRLRQSRSKIAEEHRRTSERRTGLAHRAAEILAELGSARAEAQGLASELARAEAASQAARAEISEEWGATLEMARREAEEHPDKTEDAERAELARKLKRFGDVNLLAISQEQDLRERHSFIAAQRADAEEAALELNRIIQSIDREIEVRFAETFRRVRAAFSAMVPRMMEGASGVLDLSEEGVEVGLRLGRRGWRSLRVLSGGERSLLALSFLFSVFLGRPKGEGVGGETFCVLDEAEAALDDINLARFLAVVDSHRTDGQYLLVTHQKRTMAAADVLYGVVQDATGSTTVVSKRMQGE